MGVDELISKSGPLSSVAAFRCSSIFGAFSMGSLTRMGMLDLFIFQCSTVLRAFAPECSQ